MDNVAAAKRLIALDRQRKLYAGYLKTGVISEEQFSSLCARIEDEVRTIKSQQPLDLKPAKK